HRCVDGRPLRGLPTRTAAAGDFRQPQSASEDGLDITLFPRLDTGFVHIARHAGIASEVAVDIVLGGRALDAEVAGQPEGAHAVDQAEVDYLGDAPLVAVDGLRRRTEYFRRGGPMHIESLLEGRHQVLVFRDVRHDAQLDLRVVRRDDTRTR